MTSPVLSSRAQCLQFYYHSSGVNQKNVGLEVIYKNSSTSEVLWSHSGDEGNQWNKVMIDLPAGEENYQVMTHSTHLGIFI